jgi:hypothetical protein
LEVLWITANPRFSMSYVILSFPYTSMIVHRFHSLGCLRVHNLLYELVVLHASGRSAILTGSLVKTHERSRDDASEVRADARRIALRPRTWLHNRVQGVNRCHGLMIRPCAEADSDAGEVTFQVFLSMLVAIAEGIV